MSALKFVVKVNLNVNKIKNVKRKKTKTLFLKTKLARCTGKGVAFKTNVDF